MSTEFDYDAHLDLQVEYFSKINEWDTEHLINFLYANKEDFYDYVGTEDPNALQIIDFDGIRGIVKDKRDKTQNTIEDFCTDYDFSEYLYDLKNPVKIFI